MTLDPSNGSLPTEVDVLIVGGGGCGLSASVMLSDLGVDHLLVERHPGTAVVPKAHIINPRTMEIFGQHGLADEIYDLGAPHENNSAQRWYTSLGGDEPWDRQLVHRADAWGGGALREIYAGYSAYRHGNTPQLILEPLLRRHAEAQAPGRVRFHCETLSVTQDLDSVRAVVVDRATGTEHRIRCKYLIGADGGRTVGRAVGITLDGPPPFVETESVYFRADLSAYIDDDEALIRFFNRPSLDGAPVRTGLVAAGPTRWDRHSEEWTISVTLRPDEDREAFDEARAVAAIRERLNLPDLDVEVIRHQRWTIDSLLADRYVEGRVVVAGDAAHRHSPFGGLGLNTAIQDAHNLAWKLVAILHGHAGAALLATYESERRPVGRVNVDFATVSFFNTLAAMSGFGLLPNATPEHNRSVLEAVFSDTRVGEMRRARLREYYDTMRVEARAADIELGFHYAGSAAVVDDGSTEPARDPSGQVYVPVARPGHRLPHAWLDRSAERVGTHDLQRPGAMLLIAADEGLAWCEAAEALRCGGHPIRAVRIGPHAHLRDRYGTWAEVRGHHEDGAILVRPDGHVSARFATSAAGCETAELAQALSKILCTSPLRP